MDIVNTPISSKKDFVKAFSIRKEDRDVLKSEYKVLRKALGKKKVNLKF
jgi:hypothetical protein